MYRDEFDLAILKMQEDNRLEILKRKWWDGGKCPKEEDHRAKGWSVPSFPSSSPPCPIASRPVLRRPGHGEHRGHLRGAGVRPAGGHPHGRAGVCLDVEADAGKRGETGLSNLHLLCLSVPTLAPAPSWSCEAAQLLALTGEATLPPSVKPERNNQHKAKDVPHIYLSTYTYYFPFIAVETV